MNVEQSPGDTPQDVGIPAEFLTERIVEIDDLTELHVTLTVFRLAMESNAVPPAVSERRVLGDPVLGRTFREDRSSSRLTQRLRRGLQYATARESILQVSLVSNGSTERWYVPASKLHRAQLERVLAEPGSWPTAGMDATVVAPAPSIFSLYEKNIGILTPLLIDQIETAMDLYPLDWIEEAILEAVVYNKRNWRYVQRILETWAVEGRGERGKSDATNRRDAPEPFDPAVYQQRRRRRS